MSDSYAHVKIQKKAFLGEAVASLWRHVKSGLASARPGQAGPWARAREANPGRPAPGPGRGRPGQARPGQEARLGRFLGHSARPGRPGWGRLGAPARGLGHPRPRRLGGLGGRRPLGWGAVPGSPAPSRPAWGRLAAPDRCLGWQREGGLRV